MIENTTKTHYNNFRFVLYQGEDMITERSFTADVFNPIIRYSVNIRWMIPSIIQKIQKILSRKKLNHKEFGYDFIELYAKNKEFYFDSIDKLSNPVLIKQTYSGKTIKSTEFKFGLYINDNTIVERKFHVENFQPSSRFSTEIVETINEICDDIFESLKVNDINHMWNDYAIIKKYGLYVVQIRELSSLERLELLDNINNIPFVKEKKIYYRNLQQLYQQQQLENSN